IEEDEEEGLRQEHQARGRPARGGRAGRGPGRARPVRDRCDEGDRRPARPGRRLGRRGRGMKKKTSRKGAKPQRKTSEQVKKIRVVPPPCFLSFHSSALPLRLCGFAGGSSLPHPTDLFSAGGGG